MFPSGKKTLPIFTWLIWFLIQILKVYCLRTENTSSIHKLCYISQPSLWKKKEHLAEISLGSCLSSITQDRLPRSSVACSKMLLKSLRCSPEQEMQVWSIILIHTFPYKIRNGTRYPQLCWWSWSLWDVGTCVLSHAVWQSIVWLQHRGHRCARPLLYFHWPSSKVKVQTLVWSLEQWA